MDDAVQKSHPVAQPDDPRAVRTRAAIGAAFVALLQHRPYARVRVSDVTRKARVGRATFYAHYSSKDDLLVAQLGEIVMPMIVRLAEDACLIDATRFFSHVLGARPIFRALCTGPDHAVGERLVHQAMEARVAGLLADRPALSGEPGLAPAFIPRFVAATCYALLVWALEQEASPSPADLQATFRVLVGRALAPAP